MIDSHSNLYDRGLWSIVNLILMTEVPEEVVDNRSLYDRLQQQKDLKQAEFDEQHKLSNLYLLYLINKNLYFISQMLSNLFVSVQCQNAVHFLNTRKVWKISVNKFWSLSSAICVTENQIRGLDQEEADFLEFVSERQEENEKERKKEENEVLEEYRVSRLCIVIITSLNSS